MSGCHDNYTDTYVYGYHDMYGIELKCIMYISGCHESDMGTYLTAVILRAPCFHHFFTIVAKFYLLVFVDKNIINSWEGE